MSDPGGATRAGGGAARPPRAAGPRPPWAASLRAKLILFSALLTAMTVSVAFLALHLELRKETRLLLAGTLARHQTMLAGLQKRGLEELLRASAILSESPTLRAAMETYRSESGTGTRRRKDLLATIQVEAEAIAASLRRDLLIVTDDGGRVLAATGPPAERPGPGTDLAAWPAVARALAPDAGVGPLDFSVHAVEEGVYRIGCVPIVLQGYVIGTLALGERLDQGFVEGLRDSFGSDIVVTVGSRVLGTTLPRGAAEAAAWPEDPGSAPAPAAAAPPSGAGGPAAAHVIAIAGEEYVAAPAVLGRDQEGRAVSLHLLRSLSAALAGPHRSLLATLLGYGSLVVFLAGVSASVVGRSVLRPLDGLVAFMRSAAAGADRSRRFRHEGAGAEVRVLGEAFNRLLDALGEHERRLLQDAREEMHRLERLKESEKLAALGRMLSGAAHEINNPLTGVVGNIEMLLERGGLDERVRQRLEQVRGEGRRIVALVRNLLKVARRGGGPRETVDLNQVVRDAAALRRHDFERARVGLVLDLADRPIPLPADALELQQVFLNVVNNAFDALRGRPGRPSLTVRTLDDPDQATVTFADNGPGMERPDQVFEHFYTTKPVGQGTGLGLSISQAIVHDHGGRITAENAPGGGALFRIVLPRGAAPAARPAPAPPETPAARRPLPASVLVVDDEPVVLELQMAILDGLGARAVAARSGREALDLLKARDFDLIVADLMLPGEIGGEEIHRWARANRRAGARGFLFVTGEIGGAAAAATAARRLQKPFTMEEYVAALREAWDELQTAA